MSAKKKNRENVNLNFAVGLLLLVVAAYFIILFIKSERKPHINFYEVNEGTLVKEHTYEGIILRDEETVPSEGNGYVNFYLADTRKASKGQRIYSIDESGNLKSYLSSHADELNTVNKEKLASVRNTIMHGSRDFSELSFRNSYLLKDSLDASVLEFSDIDALISVSEELKAQGMSLQEFRTEKTGYISYNIDGFEDLSVTDINEKYFDRSTYERSRLKSGDLIVTGDPVYKIIRDEKWEIVFPLTDQDMLEFEDRDSLLLSFTEKGIETSAAFVTVKGTDAQNYGVLSLNRYLVQFLSDRYISFEIVSSDVSGLKIPDKSVTSKDFYIIPSGLRSSDKNGNAGFYKETLSEEGTAEVFVVSDIYYDDGEYCYISASEGEALQRGDYIVSAEHPGERFEIGSVRELTGVYNINKGYTVFKRIEVLETANGYCIIKKNTGHGLSVYDHIVLDAASVTEGQVLY